MLATQRKIAPQIKQLTRIAPSRRRDPITNILLVFWNWKVSVGYLVSLHPSVCTVKHGIFVTFICVTCDCG